MICQCLDSTFFTLNLILPTLIELPYTEMTNFEGAILTSTDFTNANYDSHTLDSVSKDAKIILKKQGNLW